VKCIRERVRGGDPCDSGRVPSCVTIGVTLFGLIVVYSQPIP
jgi:hypothetical protein